MYLRAARDAGRARARRLHQQVRKYELHGWENKRRRGVTWRRPSITSRYELHRRTKKGGPAQWTAPAEMRDEKATHERIGLH